MSKVQLPEQISGKWIFLRRFVGMGDVTLLMRRNFDFVPESGAETLLFISGNSSYQVFVNGRLAGVGPRGHQCLLCQIQSGNRTIL